MMTKTYKTSIDVYNEIPVNIVISDTVGRAIRENSILKRAIVGPEKYDSSLGYMFYISCEDAETGAITFSGISLLLGLTMTTRIRLRHMSHFMRRQR